MTIPLAASLAFVSLGALAYGLWALRRFGALKEWFPNPYDKGERPCG